MNKSSNNSEIAFAVTTGAVLAAVLWWLIGGYILPFVLCGVDNDKRCDPALVNTISIVISLLTAATLTTLRIHKILKK